MMMITAMHIPTTETPFALNGTDLSEKDDASGRPFHYSHKGILISFEGGKMSIVQI